MRSRAGHGFWAITAVLAASGCGKIEVRMGTRVSLPTLQIASMQLAQYKHPGIGPGEKSSLVATFTEPDGTVLVTEGKGGGKVLWSDLTVTATVVSVSKKGVIKLPSDPRTSYGKIGHVSVTVPSHPTLHAELDVPLRYNYAFAASFSGADGSKGLDGNDGTDGAMGTSGSMDPDNPSPGGDGGNGSDGTAGSNGGDGSDGPSVKVDVTVQSGPQTLLQIGVISGTDKERYYLVDPNGGSLTVSSMGGSGGKGGSGGRGGRGGMGGSGTPDGNSGRDGSNGSDGLDGQNGRGGPITVTYDPKAQPYLNALHLSNPGGPKPTLVEQAVSPLW